MNEGANERIAKLADDQHVFYLDIGPKFLDPDGTLSKEIMPDLLHPNAKGYEIWADVDRADGRQSCLANRHEPLVDRRPDEPDRRLRHPQGVRSGGEDEGPDQSQHRATSFRHAGADQAGPLPGGGRGA